MVSAAQLNAWLEEAARSGTITDGRVRRAPATLPWAKGRGITVMLEGSTSVLGENVTVRLGVTDVFPDELPYVQLAAMDDALPDRPLAHLEGDGNICFSETRELVFDPQKPVELLNAAVTAALDTLASSLTDPGTSDLLDDFTAYWHQGSVASAVKRKLQSYFTPDENMRVVHAWRRADLRFLNHAGQRVPRPKPNPSEDQVIFAVADTEEAPAAFGLPPGQTLNRPSATALYVPLRAGPTLLPPAPGGQWTPTQLRDVIRGNLSPAELTHLDQLLAARRIPNDLIVLGIPRPTGTGAGTYTAVAVDIRGMKGNHLLLTDSSAHAVRLMARLVTRHDRAYVMQRGGSDDTLSNKKVLLLGCGALGGHLAFMLAASGIGHLTLVDHDYMSEDNAFRHVLGRSFLGISKANALAVSVKGRYPYLETMPIYDRTERALTDGRVNLTDFDLIIDATGNGTHHLTLARLLEAADHPPVVLAWLEALGLGGHTATVFKGEPGCPRCLYSNPRAPLTNVASFSAPGQDLGKAALACGSYYTAFSDLDAIRTAEFAARGAVDILNGKHTRTLLHSWKGDPEAFLRAGHQVSQRFKAAKRRQLREGVPYAAATCPACGRKL